MKPQSDLTGLAVDEIGMRLLRAAEIIRERGWCQGTLGGPDKRVCMVGALRLAYGLALHIGPMVGPCEVAYYRLKEHLGMPVTVASWNDHAGRTADDAIAALTAAALSHAAQGVRGDADRG